MFLFTDRYNSFALQPLPDLADSLFLNGKQNLIPLLTNGYDRMASRARRFTCLPDSLA